LVLPAVPSIVRREDCSRGNDSPSSIQNIVVVHPATIRTKPPLPKISTATPTLATELYALDGEIIFNVLDQVEFDSRTGKLNLVGHLDTKYATSGIPYLQYLSTLLDTPNVEFSLEWTRDSESRVADLKRRLDSDAEWRRLAGEWGRWIDDSERITPAGEVLMPLFGIQLPRTPKMDRYQVLSGVFFAIGNKKGSRILDAFREFYRALPNPQEEDLRYILREAGVDSVFRDARKAVNERKLTMTQGEIQIYRALFTSLDETFNYPAQATLRAFDNGLRRGAEPSAAMEAGLTEFDRQIRPTYGDALRKLFSSKREIQVPVTLVNPALQGSVNVVPTYGGVDRSSLLAKLLLEADYTAKALVNLPELAGRIPGYQTEFTYRLNRQSAPKGGGRASQSRLWISVDNIDASRSADGHVLALGQTKMRINMRELGADGRDLPNQGSGEYDRLLTSLYDGFAREYSPVFHELREAAKLAYVAQWIKVKKSDFKLPLRGRAVWNGPATVPGVIFITWSPGSGPDVQMVSAIGGVSLRVPPAGAGVCVQLCADKLPVNPQIRPVNDASSRVDTLDLLAGTGGSRLLGAALVGLFHRISEGTATAQTPIRSKQLPSIKCLAGQAAGLPGLGTLTAPPIVNDPNTLASAILNSAWDGTGKFSADCELRVDQAMRADRSVRAEVESKFPAAKLAMQEKFNDLIQNYARTAREFEDANVPMREADACVRRAMRQHDNAAIKECGQRVTDLAKNWFAKKNARDDVQKQCKEAEVMVEYKLDDGATKGSDLSGQKYGTESLKDNRASKCE